MGLLKPDADSKRYTQHIEAGVAAWNEGRLAFSCVVAGPLGEGLTHIEDSLLRVGWWLHSTSLAHAGTHTLALLTFVRPR